MKPAVLCYLFISCSVSLVIKMAEIPANKGLESVSSANLSAWGDSSKQIGQRSCSERAAGEVLRFPHLFGVLEGSAVDDLGSVSPPVEPGVQPAQGRLPLNAPLGPLARSRVLGGRVQEPQRV